MKSDADLFHLLPRSNATLFFANLDALRKGGVISVVSSSKTVAEPEYRRFVRETHFDYAKDIHSIAAAVDVDRILIAIHGRFDWGKLRGYAESHRGVCKGAFCNLPANKAGRWISFITIQPDVMLLAVSGDSVAALDLSQRVTQNSESVPAFPVWLRVPRTVLVMPQALPPAVRIFAISLQSAETVLLWLDRNRNGGSEFVLGLDARAPSIPTAETIKTQLELETKMLQIQLAREHQKAVPDDLTGLLVAGRFELKEKHVIGSWPVRKALLNSLE